MSFVLGLVLGVLLGGVGGIWLGARSMAHRIVALVEEVKLTRSNVP